MLVAAVLMAGTAACSGAPDDDGPARVSELPAGVTGLGPAVFLTAVADERRTDLRGLIAVDRLGDDLAGVQPVRRHVELALADDPAAPTVARGLAEDPRDALLSEGRVRDVELPGRSFVREATSVGDLVITRNTCLVVRADGQIRRPTEGEVSCRRGAAGGIIWQDRTSGAAGGVDLTTGEPLPGLVVPGEPLSATPDGRHVFSVVSKRLVITDTETGTIRHTEVETARADSEGEVAVTARGYYFVRAVDGVRRLSLLGLDGTVTELMSPVGRFTVSPDLTRAVLTEARDGVSRLVLLDLDTGRIRTPTGDAGPQRSVTATLTGRHALIAESPADAHTEPVPLRMWTLDLATARLTTAPAITASSVERAGGTLAFSPDGPVVALSDDGRPAVAPNGAEPWTALPDGRVLFRVPGHPEQADRLLVTGVDGQQVDITTGAGPEEHLRHLTITPDGGHALVALRGEGGRAAAGPQSRLVVTRLDGTGEPVVLYRGVELVSLGDA